MQAQAGEYAGGMAAWLLVIGDKEALGWVLAERRMAFQQHRREQARRLQEGDSLLLYTTRGCFRNPTRDRGLVIAKAKVASPVEVLDDPVEIAGRRFELGCEIAFDSLTPRGAGVVLAELVAELDAFPDPASWSARMRRPLVALPSEDHELITARLTPQLRPAGKAIGEYLRLARPPRSV